MTKTYQNYHFSLLLSISISEVSRSAHKFSYHHVGSSPTPFHALGGIVTVKNGKIAKVDHVGFFSYRSDAPKKADKTHFRTIAQIFDLFEKTIVFEKTSAGSDISTVVISPDLGFPEMMSIDHTYLMVDDEFSIRVEDFEILEE